MSQVTSRTLRHYDEIGLLRPARVGGNGYRYYEREQLLRLQQILLLRELGLGLEAIGAILDGEHDRVEALCRHHRWLLAERDRLTRLADTVRRTITQLQGGDELSEAELFEGFDPERHAERRARFEAELVERYGDGVREHFAESARRTGTWTASEYQAVERDTARVEERLVELLLAGAAVDDPAVLAAVGEHYELVRRFWTPDRHSYIGLGQWMADSPEFRARFDARHPALAGYLRDAMTAYAQARLDA
jgi:MerR family transcriptional regulator, thiopeptide resistance regulator